MNSKRLILKVVGLFFLLLFLLVFSASRTPLGAMLTYLPFGWWPFLKRNIPQISFNWGLVSTGVICSVFVIVLGNWFMSVLYGQIQIWLHPDKLVRKWKWGWTASLYASIWILFLIAFGAAGVSQHAAWLLNYDQPWYKIRRWDDEIFSANRAIDLLLMDNNQDLERTRKAVLAEYGHWREAKMLCEDFNIIFYGDSSNHVAAYLIIPRDRQLIAKGKFMVNTPDAREMTQPFSQLQQTLSALDAKYSVKLNY